MSDTVETIKCKITNISDKETLSSLLKNWTCAFHRVFSDYAKYGKKHISTKEYNSMLSDTFKIKAKEIEHLKSQVTQKIEQCNTRIEQLRDKRDSLQNSIVKDYLKEDIEKFKLNKNSRKAVVYYRKLKKLNRINKQVEYFDKNPYGIVFGGKEILQRIGYISNLKKLSSKEEWREFAISELRRNQPNRVLNEKDINQKVSDLKEELKKLPLLKEEYKKKRLIPYYAIGDSGVNGGKENCNVIFDLFLKEKCVVFKPNRHTKIKIDFTSNDKDLEVLDKANKNKQLAITVIMDDDYICFSYDTFKLYNVLPKFDKKDSSNCKNKINDEINNIYNKRNQNYVAAIDLNPQEIGLSVIKILSDNTFKVVKAYNFSLKNIKLVKGEKSTSKKYKKTANLLKIEQGLICKKIISILNYYNVGYFVMDDVKKLSAKGDLNRNKQINRLFTQVWHKDRIMYLLSKHCNKYGIKVLDKITNAYTSIIGNINYPFYDSVNASVDLARRGALKIKNENKFDYNEYCKVDNNDIKNIKVFLTNEMCKSGTQSDVPITEHFSTWKEFAEFLKKQDLYKTYRKKSPITCCGNFRGMGYNSISRIEKYSNTNMVYPLAKLFSSNNNDVNSLKINSL